MDFCRSLIDVTADLASCYKPNAAFWEQYGPRGWQGLSVINVVPMFSSFRNELLMRRLRLGGMTPGSFL